MTNGEKIKEIFPEAQIEYGESDVYIWLNHEPVNFSREAWESNYSEIPNNSTTDVPDNNVGKIAPTAKNDLAVDCVSREKVWYMITNGKYPNEDYEQFIDRLVNELSELPSVTPQLSSELEKNSKKLEKDFGELDCISRADAIQAMQDKAKKLTNEDTINGLCGAVAILFDLPSVTPQERKGYWISTETKGVRYAFWCRYKCSLCGGLSDRTNFCPNCGARMESEE